MHFYDQQSTKCMKYEITKTILSLAKYVWHLLRHINRTLEIMHILYSFSAKCVCPCVNNIYRFRDVIPLKGWSLSSVCSRHTLWKVYNYMSKYDIFTTSLEDISILTYLNTHAASSLLDPWLCQKMHNIIIMFSYLKWLHAYVLYVVTSIRHVFWMGKV